MCTWFRCSFIYSQCARMNPQLFMHCKCVYSFINRHLWHIVRHNHVHIIRSILSIFHESLFLCIFVCFFFYESTASFFSPVFRQKRKHSNLFGLPYRMLTCKLKSKQQRLDGIQRKPNTFAFCRMKSSMSGVQIA